MTEQAEHFNVPDNWVVVPFSDLFLDPKNNIVDGPFGSNLKASEYTSEGVPVIRIQNIDRNRFIDKNINYVTVEKAEFLSRHSFKKGDIIITKLGAPLGKACFVPEKYEEGIIVADLIRARVDHKHINPKFLVYQLNSPALIKQFDKFTKGTTRPRIRLSIARGLNFKLPPLNEQNQIVDAIEELLSDLENGLESLRIAQNQLEVYKHSLLKHAFFGGLTQKWRIVNSPESATQLIDRIKKERLEKFNKDLGKWKREMLNWRKTIGNERKPVMPKKPIFTDCSSVSALPNLPFGWKWESIGNVSDLVSGQHITKADYNNSGKGTAYLTGPSGFGKRFPIISKWTITPKAIALTDDVLITVKGSGVGKINLTSQKISIGRQLMAIRPLIDNLYVYYFLESKKSSFEKIAKGTAIPGISREQILELQIPICSLPEQKLIVQNLESQFSITDHLESTIEDGIQKSEALRQSILEKAFEGKLVDQDPQDAQASELLKRIQVERKKYREEQKLQKREVPKKTKKMSKELSITDILKASDKPMLAKDIWQQSKHKDDIEGFYAELKKIQGSIKEVKKGTESLLSFMK